MPRGKVSIDKKPCHAVEVPSIPHKRATDIDCFVEVRHEETCDSWGTSH